MYNIESIKSETVSACRLDTPSESFGRFDFPLHRSEATRRKCAVFDGLSITTAGSPSERNSLYSPHHCVHYFRGISPSIAFMISYRAFQSFEQQLAL